MITVLNVKFEPAKKEFHAFVDGAFVASGIVEFTNSQEQDLAKKMAASAVAAGYGCKESDVYITIHKHYE